MDTVIINLIMSIPTMLLLGKTLEMGKWLWFYHRGRGDTYMKVFRQQLPYFLSLFAYWLICIALCFAR